MGADMADKQELQTGCFSRADVVACDLLSQCRVIGELHHALDAGAVEPTEVVELGELTGGRRLGRTSDDQITICDLTGVGVQDTAIARLAYARAVERGLGTLFASV
jgi:ornithine cyclodeaminase/alanine dehydrogenase-like protein (mu-crystallin family)